jgi:hypothetical protein
MLLTLTLFFFHIVTSFLICKKKKINPCDHIKIKTEKKITSRESKGSKKYPLFNTVHTLLISYKCQDCGEEWVVLSKEVNKNNLWPSMGKANFAGRADKLCFPVPAVPSSQKIHLVLATNKKSRRLAS